MKVFKKLFVFCFLFCSVGLLAQIEGEKMVNLIGDKLGLDGVSVPQTRVHIGTGIDRVFIDKSNNGIGTGYFSFNNYYRHQGPSYPWYRKGNGTHNGGAIISATSLGDLQFFPVNSTGGGSGIVTNAAMKKRMVLKISHNNTENGNGYVQVNDGYKAVHIGEASGFPFDGNGYVGFNVQKDESSNSWKTVSNGARNGGNVVYSTLDGTFVVSALGNTGAGVGVYSDEEVKDNAVLTVNKNGLLKTKEIKVQTTLWPDYVFAKDYNLRPLSEVENFIELNNHLPEVPSAAEVLKEGLNLGDMNVILLQKVEELTLYILEQEKKINALENKWASQFSTSN